MCIRDSDSTVTFTVGSRKLNEVQKTALASGYALYLPENNKEATRHLLFCKADFEQGRIEAVSYTHLDVYKRQLLSSFKTGIALPTLLTEFKTI